MQDNQGVAPASAPLSARAFSAALGHAAIEQEIIELLFIEFEQSVQEGRDFQRGGIVVDGSDFGCGVALELALNKGRKSEGMSCGKGLSLPSAHGLVSLLFQRGESPSSWPCSSASTPSGCTPRRPGNGPAGCATPSPLIIYYTSIVDSL